MRCNETETERLRQEVAYYRRQIEKLSATVLRSEYKISSLHHQLAQKRQSFSILTELQQSIDLETPVTSIFERTLQAIVETLDMDRAVVLSPMDRPDYYEPVRWMGFEPVDSDWLEATQLHIPRERVDDFPFVLKNSSTSPSRVASSLQAALDLPFFICVPIQMEQTFAGCLVAGRLTEGSLHRARLDKEDVETLRAIASLIAAAVQNQEMAALRTENKRKEVELQRARELEETNRELEAARSRLQEQADELRRLDEMKSRFFADISHGLRTPLMLIIGPLEDALEGRYGAFPDSLREVHQSMLQNARRLVRFIGQLLDLSKLEHGKPSLDIEEGDILDFVDQLVRRFAPLAERREIVLHFQHPGTLISACFDAAKLDKICSNLLSNALKFTPAGGKVWMTVREQTAGGDRCLEIVVKDTGPGIPPGEIDRIFDRFRQVHGRSDRSLEGTGIGLTLAQQLAQLHGGEITVESEEGFGSTFTVRLPKDPATVEESGGTGNSPRPSGVVPIRPVSEERNLSSERSLPDPLSIEESHGEYGPSLPARRTSDASILLVDDNADVRAYLRGHLEEYYQVIEAGDGAAALRLAREHTPSLVIADVVMPRVDGFELVEALAREEALQAVPVILITARAAPRNTIAGLEIGADDFLTKPFSGSELQARVRSLLRSREELRERYSRELVIRPSDVVISSEEEVFVRNVLDVVNEHLSDSTFGIDRLADALDLSRRHLTRRVKQTTGETPGELLRRVRLQRAAQLLKQEAGAINDIAAAVGFRSASHFSKAFRKRFGTVPSQVSENGT